MKCLVIGNGGREHAISWKLAQSPKVEQVFVAPGNAGTANEDKITNVDIDAIAINELIKFAKDKQIDLTIVGPEAPLDAGIVDQFSAHSLAIVGPTQAATQLEASKSFGKAFMQANAIPTARAETFDEPQQAKSYLYHCDYPIVIKADGLAAGKGVIICQTQQEAVEAVEQLLHLPNQAKIMIEDFLRGEEASYIVLCDGENFVPLASSQDHKARDNGDKGPNTGGMGAYSPAPCVTADIEQRIINDVIKPTLEGMAASGTPYRGFLYAGIMLSDCDDINVLEFNCRLGDPETQVLMMRMASDFAELCLLCAEQKLDQAEVSWHAGTALGVVIAAQGYPAEYPKGEIIGGLESIDNNSAKVFHAGTKLDEAQNIVSNGGRVLCVTALAANTQQAFEQAYSQIPLIDWNSKFYRSDIGYRAI